MKHLVDYIFEALGEVNGFCILKPEFLSHEEDFCNLLINNGWRIIQKCILKLSLDEAKELYKDKAKEKYYDDLCAYMSSGDCLCCMCYKDTKDPIEDMKKLKDKVRKSWGKDDMKNAMHSSDSLENVKREYKLVFEKKSITEKLHISKGMTSIDKYFTPGELLLRIYLSSSEKTKELNRITLTGTGSSSYLIEYRGYDTKNERINFTSSFNEEDVTWFDYEGNPELNSNGYYEFDNVANYNWTSKSIYLKKDDAVELLKNLDKDINYLKRYMYKYFDTNDEFSSIIQNNINKRMVEKCLEEYGEI